MDALHFSLTNCSIVCKAFGGDLDDYIEGNDGKDIIVGDFAFYDTWSNSTFPELILTINCSIGGADTLYGGEGQVDYIVGGTLNDTIYADDHSSTDSHNSDVVFGDHAEIMFYMDESHKLKQAITIDSECDSSGSDFIALGPADDLVSYIQYNAVVLYYVATPSTDNQFFL